jgi:REP element-mobilizing transposase RayT
MPRPIVIAYHLIWTAYGWWLPNDPRGSTSHRIASDVLADLGELHYGRRKIQPPRQVVREFYERARDVLKFPLLELSAADVTAAAEGFAAAISRERYTCYACAIMPDHVHIIIRKHKHQAEDMLENLQDFSRLRLYNCGLRSFDHPVWGGPGWKVFLDTPTDVRRTIQYIQENPPTWQLPLQRWPFVKPYDGWPLHPGHNSDSPYAQRLQDIEE